MPAELFFMLCTYMDHQDLRALATSSHSLCSLLLPEYLRRRGLVLKDTSARGVNVVELHDLSGYASLGLWSVVRIFYPPEDMFCPIPRNVQEARSAMRLLVRFLRDPLNTCNLRSFHILFPGSDPYLLMPGLCQLQCLFHTLPLRELCISGFCSTDYPSPPASLRSGWSVTCRTLTSFTISSDHAFAPELVRTTMGILKHSPIKSLVIYTVSLNPCQWSTLLGLSMMSLEELDVEGDIPRPALLRFLSRHRGLKTVRIRGNIGSDRTLTRRSRHQHFLPNLLTLRAPLAVCCDIVERSSDSSNIFDLEVDVNQLRPFDPLLIRLMENLRRFPKLEYFGFRVGPSPLSVTSQESSNDHDRDEHPACRLKQVRSLSFMQTRGRLSPGDIVCHHLPFLIFPILSECQNTMCTLAQLFPTLETVCAVEEKHGVGMELVRAFCKAKPTLRVVTVISGSLESKWEADAERAMDN